MGWHDIVLAPGSPLERLGEENWGGCS